MTPVLLRPWTWTETGWAPASPEPLPALPGPLVLYGFAVAVRHSTVERLRELLSRAYVRIVVAEGREIAVGPIASFPSLDRGILSGDSPGDRFIWLYRPHFLADGESVTATVEGCEDGECEVAVALSPRCVMEAA